MENEDKEDAADLRRELSKLGITVRNDGKKTVLEAARPEAIAPQQL